MARRPLISPLFPYTALFRSIDLDDAQNRRVLQKPPAAGAARVVRRGVDRHSYPPARPARLVPGESVGVRRDGDRSEEHTSELQSLRHLVCRLLLDNRNIMHL